MSKRREATAKQKENEKERKRVDSGDGGEEIQSCSIYPSRAD